jgi:hypothetical protein
MAEQRLDPTEPPTPRGYGAGDYDAHKPDGSSYDARDSDALGRAERMPEPPITDLKADPDFRPVRPPTTGPQTWAAVEEDANLGHVHRYLPAYPDSPAGTRALTGGIAGALGSVFLAALMYVLFWGNLVTPTFLAAERAWFGQHGLWDHVLGVIGYVVAGGVWGAIFGLLVPRPTMLKGMLFGVLPTLFLWLVVAPLMHQPLFLGGRAPALLLPLLFNVLIWGSYVGRFCERRLRPPYTTATTPTTPIT